MSKAKYKLVLVSARSKTNGMDNETAIIETISTNDSNCCLNSASHYFEEIENARVTVITIEIVLVTLILIGNSFVLALFWQERKYHNTSHKYIISMAISDIVQGLCSAPVVAFLSTGVKIGSQECLIALIIGSAAAIVSLIIIFITSLDRFWAIVYPVSYKTKSTAKTAKSE